MQPFFSQTAQGEMGVEEMELVKETVICMEYKSVA